MIIIIVGGTGTGKTTLCKEIITNYETKNRYILDFNNEYANLKNKYTKLFNDYDIFIEKLPAFQNSYILIDEASIYFNSHRYSNILLSKLVKHRHDKNIILLCFHSLRLVPKYVNDFCNYIIIKKTNDNLDLLKIDQKIIDLSRIVNNNPDNYFYEVLRLNL